MKTNKKIALKILLVGMLSSNAFALVSGTTDTPSAPAAAGVFAAPPPSQQTISATNNGSSQNQANKPFQLPDNSAEEEEPEIKDIRSSGAHNKSSSSSSTSSSTSTSAKTVRTSNKPLTPETNNDVKQILIEATKAHFGKCACPYSENSDGFECGVESRYYKASNEKSYCYPQDFRGQQMIFYRKNH